MHKSYLLAEGDTVSISIEEESSLGKDIEGISPGRSIADVEKDLILNTLAHFGGDKKAAAESLGISLKTLYNRLGQYDAGEGN